MLLEIDSQQRRQCGTCTLCCKLLAVRELDKLAGQRCRHQRHGKGCAVYKTRAMPLCCRIWNCRWLVNDDTADLSRPDRSHYVIDILPDYVTAIDNDTGKSINIEVIQIWIDPHHPDAHRDPHLRAYLERQGKPGIIRYSSSEAFVLVPPQLNGGQWCEHRKTSIDPHRQYSLGDVERALSDKQ